MTSALFTLVRRETQVGLQASLRALWNWRDLEVLPAKSRHHADRAQAFLGLGKQGTVLFLDGGGFRSEFFGEEIDRAHHERNYA